MASRRPRSLTAPKKFEKIRSGPDAYSPAHRWKTKLRTARLKWVVEMALRGHSNGDIGKALGRTKWAVDKMMQRAAAQGIIEQVQEELLTALQQTPSVYSTIFSTPASDLNDHAKGFKLKLDAADALTKGYGLLKNQTETTQTRVNLIGYHQQKALDAHPDTDAIDAEPFIPPDRRLEGPDGPDEPVVSGEVVDGPGPGDGDGESPSGDPEADR